MGTEIATITDREMASLMPLLMRCDKAADMSESELRAIVAFADAPPPALLAATEDDVRQIVAFLAATLKAPRTGIDGGRIKLGAYRLTLTGKPKAAIQHATQAAIRNLEWMPTPAELIRLVDAYLAPEQRAHSRARYIARTMRQRAFEDRCKAIRSRTFPQDQFHTLTEQELHIGITNRALLKELDGTVIPWTLEDEKRILAARKAAIGWDEGGSPPTDERDKRADEAPDRCASRGSVGNLADGIMEGMEVSDDD